MSGGITRAYEGGKTTRGYEGRRREKDGRAIASRRGRMCGRMYRRRGVKEIKECKVCQPNAHREKDGGGGVPRGLLSHPNRRQHHT
jgi:hypothetical protein